MDIMLILQIIVLLGAIFGAGNKNDPRSSEDPGGSRHPGRSRC